MSGFLVFVAGVLFALGLGISGMTNPNKVIGFLDVSHTWDPSLALVMVGAIGAHGLLRPLVLKRPKPIFASAFQEPKNCDIPGKMLIGAGLFGIGWGISGICPGPGIVGVASGTTQAWTFLLTMTVGMAAYGAITRGSDLSAATVPSPKQNG